MEKKFNTRLTQLQRSKIRKFGFSFAAGMAILCAVSIWRHEHFHIAVTIASATLSVTHLAFALFCRKCLTPMHAVTGFLGRIIGNILITTIFTTVFFFIFTPISLILRLAGKDHIQRNQREPGWIEVEAKDNDPSRIERLF
jgi:hypothetical protein